MRMKGKITKAFLKYDEESCEENLSIEFKLDDGFSCLLTFDEVNSYSILSKFDKNPVKKDPHILVGKTFILLSHPGGGTLAPIGLKTFEDENWIYKKEGEWCRWI